MLQQHIINYAKTRDTYVAYRKAGYSKKFLAEHEPEIILHKAAKQFFDEQGLKKLPTVKSLQTEYAQLLSEKKAMYADYQKAREDMRSLQTAKANVDRILGDDSLAAERETEKYTITEINMLFSKGCRETRHPFSYPKNARINQQNASGGVYHD